MDCLGPRPKQQANQLKSMLIYHDFLHPKSAKIHGKGNGRGSWSNQKTVLAPCLLAKNTIPLDFWYVHPPVSTPNKIIFYNNYGIKWWCIAYLLSNTSSLTNDRTVKFNPHFVQITWVILGIYSDKRIKPILNNSHKCVFSIPFTLVNANYKHLPNVVKSKTSDTYLNPIVKHLYPLFMC